MIYLDDISIFAVNFETHLKRIEAVSLALEKANLKLKPESVVLS